MTTRTTVLLALALVAVPAASAQARRRPLAGQPAVRHKQELRDKRFEVAPTFDMSVAADLKNTYSAGLKAEYHLTDMLSIGGLVFFGVSADTGLAAQIRDSLPDNVGGDPTPTKSQFDDHLNTTPLHGGAGVTLTPWFGKMALFGKAFVNFDIYVKGGVSFASLKNQWDGGKGRQIDNMDPAEMCAPGTDNRACYTDPRNDDPQNAGFKPGIMLGAGLHVYVNRWVAVDLSFHDYLYSDNPSGLDFDHDQDVDGDDRRFLSHLFFNLGVSMYLPAKIKISP